MAQLVNQARIAQGLNPVAISAELTAAAEAHTQDMIAHGYMEHEARDGSTPQQRAVRHGYLVPPRSAWIVVEVISARATAEAAVNWLLSDRLHRGVMLRATWREMGISYVQGGSWGQLWTIDFGCRPNVLPAILEPAAGGGGLLHLTNENCAPAGGNAEQIGKAAQMMVSDRSDFRDGVWEAFATTRPVSSAEASLYVKLKDARGREVITGTGTNAARLGAATVASPHPSPTPSPSDGTATPASSPPLVNVGGPALLQP